jgi:predicted acetyltransferase
MRGHGYHVSMLFGIPNFYHRFGYATTLAEYFVSMDVAELPVRGTGKYTARAVKPGDIPALQRIHRENNAGVPCSLIRSAAHFTNKWRRIEHARVFTNEQGKVAGYIVAHTPDGMLDVTEAGLDSPEVAPDLLANCSAAAQEAHRPRVRFALPPEHPLAHVLARYESAHEMRLTRESGGMMTFVDVAEALENLVPEWEARATANGLSEHSAEATLVVDDRPFRVRSHRGAIDVAPGPGGNKFSLSGGELVRLVTGYAHLEDVYGAERRLITSDGRMLLAALFPKRNPYVHLFDRF